MKQIAVVVSMLFAIAVVAVALAPVAVAGKTHMVKAEIVSVDIPSKAITFKDDKGENHTAPVMGKAAEMLATLKAGDKVTLTCSDTDQGTHEGVTAIKVEKA